MTKKLEETFNLPQEVKKTKELKKNYSKTKAQDIIDPESIADHDQQMDDYAKDAYEYAKEIMEFGMAVDPRHAADAFTAAANMMKVAVEAKNSKLDKKARLYDLELKRQKLDLERAKATDSITPDDFYSREDILDDD